MKVIRTTISQKVETATPLTDDELQHYYVECEVIIGGNLSNKKGVNTPTVVLPISAMTEKDKKYV
jgi:pyruvate kinase